jgi:hypothetical protein
MELNKSNTGSVPLVLVPLEQQFLESLDEKELIAYNIAKSHLGTLFSLNKSNAYLEWLSKIEISK